MFGCDLVFTVATAAQVRQQIEEKTGQPCPCKTGKRCPLLPEDLTPLLTPVRVEAPAADFSVTGCGHTTS